eukprot:9639279-Alexandrium_andersonii.AAC.1
MFYYTKKGFLTYLPHHLEQSPARSGGLPSPSGASARATDPSGQGSLVGSKPDPRRPRTQLAQQGDPTEAP